jgi:hypothetical protein
MDGPQDVAADPKVILHGAVHREKPLCVRGGLKTPHLTLPATGSSCAYSATVGANRTTPSGPPRRSRTCPGVGPLNILKFPSAA